MSNPLLLTGNGEVPTVSTTTNTEVSIQQRVSEVGNLTAISRQGTGFIETDASYNSDADQEIRIEVTDTATVDVGQFNQPTFSGASTDNSEAIVVTDVGAAIATGEYNFEITNASNPAEQAQITLMGELELTANTAYVEEDVSGLAGNNLRVSIFERIDSISNNNPLDITDDIITGSGISYLETSILSGEFLDPSQTSDNSPIALGLDELPEITSELIYVGQYEDPGLFFWGVPSIDTPIYNYPIRGDYFKVYKTFESHSFKVKTLTSQTSVPNGLTSYQISGSFVVRVSLLDPGQVDTVDHYYTHFINDLDNAQEIRTLGQLALAIKQHQNEGLYVNDQFVGTAYKVPLANDRYNKPLVVLSFPEANLPNTTSATSWQNKILGPTNESKIDSLSYSVNALALLRLTGQPVFTETITVTGVVDDSNVSFQVYAPETSKFISLNPQLPLASLSLGQSLSTLLPSLGFDLQIIDKNLSVSDLAVVDPSLSIKATITKVLLVGDSFDNERQFHPYLESCGFLPENRNSMRAYNLRWTKFQPLLCSSASTQDDFDNVIYDSLGGASVGSDLSNLFFTLTDSSLYRPDFSYSTQAKTVWNTFNGNPYTFKNFKPNLYLHSVHGRSNEFLPYLSYSSNLTSAVVTAETVKLDSYIDAFARQALDYEVLEGPDSNYFIVQGARFFEPESEGSFTNSNDLDEIFGAGFSVGFFEALTGVPGGTPAPNGNITSWPVSAAYRESYLGLANSVPVGELGRNPTLLSYPKFADDTINTTITTHYNEVIPDLDPTAANVVDTHHNFTHHLLGMFSQVFNYVGTYLEDFDPGDSIAGTLVSDIRDECFQVMKDILDYMDDPVAFVTTLLTSYYTTDTEFADKVLMYDQITRQPRASLDEKGFYLEDSPIPTFKLPLFDDELETFPGLANSCNFLGTMPYSTVYKTAMKVLIDNRLATGVGMADDKVIVVPKPDNSFWGVHNFVAEGELTYLKPYSSWGYFDNNSIVDILAIKVAKVLLKGKWVVDFSFLENPLISLAPNVNQEGVEIDSGSSLVYQTFETDFWKITKVNGGLNIDTSNTEYEPNDRVYNGTLWINSLRDTTFKMDFDCEPEKAALAYGDEIKILPDNFLASVNTDSFFAGSAWSFHTSTGSIFSLANGLDDGGSAALSFQPANADSQTLNFLNESGTVTTFLFAATDSIIEFTITPVTRLSKGDTFTFNLQGGKFKTTLDGGSLVTGLDITAVSQNLYSLLDLSFVFDGPTSFVTGDFWVIQLENESSANHLFDWSLDSWNTDSPTSDILFDFGSSIAVDTIVLCGHNLEVGDTVLIEADDSPTWGTPGFSQVLTVPSPLFTTEFPLFLYLTSGISFRYFKFTFAGTNNVSIRKMFLSDTATNNLMTGFILPPKVQGTLELFYIQISGVNMASFISRSLVWSELMHVEDFKNLKAILDHSKLNSNEPIVLLEDVLVDNSGLVGTIQNDRLLSNPEATLATLNESGALAIMAGVNVTFQQEEQ